ncbi:MAG TPA: type I polyketide synthase, partial [Longimicrobium sp.]|nr:type I polyketide synthase [Longimicrobium sp.]
AIDAYSGAGVAESVVANRLSYALDLRGPSLTVDTACSGSLVALHLAARSLAEGECGLALVGGVNLVLEPTTNVFFTKAGILSSEGRCRPFDHRADGTVRGEGAGMVVLKPLEAALEDGDRVYAVVRGTAVNHNGRSNGLMAPSQAQQAALLRAACRRAGVAPADVQYVEAHGTGTRLGDPIEVEAIAEVYGAGREPGRPCSFGSVKATLGHLEAAAGIAGLIKVALALHRRRLPGMPGFERLNPLISLGDSLRVQAGPGGWPSPGRTLLAGVSSFGLGGANAHAVLEEAPRPAAARPNGTRPDGAAARPHLLALSARHPEALRELSRRYRDLLADPAGPSPGDLCRAAAWRRGHHRHRVALAGGREALVAGLEAFASGSQPPAAADPRVRPRLAWLFSGQGSHWAGMGLALAERFGAFRDTLHRADRAYRALAGVPLLEVLADPRALERTETVQPAIAAVQMALAALLRSLGVVPDAVAGQSLGEVAAAAAAGCLEVEDAMVVVHHRARLMARAAGTGATAFVGLPPAEAERLLRGRALAVAGHTAPTACIVAGAVAEVEDALAALAADGVRCRRIADGGVAFHSPAMDPLVPELERALAGLKPGAGEVPFYSSLTGAPVADGELGAAYWGRNLRTPFSLPAVVGALAAAGAGTFLEIGPHPVLARPLLEILAAGGRGGRVLATLTRDAGDEAPLLATMAALYEQGHPVEGLYPAEGAWVDLPLYPWRRRRHWVERGADPFREGEGPRRAGGAHPLLGARRDLAAGDVAAVWEQRLAATTLHYLDEHRFLGSPVLPGAAVAEAARAAARELLGGSGVELRDLAFHRLLHLDAGAPREVQLLARRAPGGLGFVLASRDGGGEGAWTVHATGRAEPGGDGANEPAPLDPGTIGARCPGAVGADAHYARMRDLGLEYGPAFQVVESVARGDGEALARLRLPAELRQECGAYAIHPALLDGALQVLAWLAADGDGPRLPAAVGRLRWHRAPGPELWCHATLAEGAGSRGALAAELRVADPEGRPVATLGGVRLRPLGGAADDGSAERWLHAVAWEEVALPGTGGDGAPESWLVLADGGGVAEAVARRLRAAGHHPVLVRPGDTLEAAAGASPWRARPGSADDFAALLEGAPTEAPPLRRVLHLWSLD